MLITKTAAIDLTDNFRDGAISQIAIPLAWRFDKADVQTLVDTSTGFIRFYAGLKVNSSGEFELTLVAVPTDNVNEGDDMISGANPLIFDFSSPCPVACDQANSPLLPAPGSPLRVPQVFNRK